jgi:protoporphyrinogen oxidase
MLILSHILKKSLLIKYNLKKIKILGAGIAGITASYELDQNNIKSIILEKNNSWGGLLDNFSIKGFRFDKFIHLSFSKFDYVNQIFKKTSHYKHSPKAYNYYKGKWIKHPVQNNLFSLSSIEKKLIIDGFKKRTKKNINEIHNYEDWLRVQYGDYFAEKFPLVYTKKYWTLDAKNLETKWVGSRMHVPSIEEIKKGCRTETLENKYYADEMRYPKKGGYKSFLEPLVKNLNIKYNCQIKTIDFEKKELIDFNNLTHQFDNLISSLPLTEICKMIKNIPKEVREASLKLKHTSGFIISLGFNKPNIPKHLWFYIYDENIPVARVYSPSLKSKNNVPKGCSSIQAELYFDYKNISNYKKEDLLENIINKFIEMGLFCRDDILVKDIRCEKYANVIFDHNIYLNRKIVLDYLNKNDVISIGRFGEWDYFWSDQSMVSGRNGAIQLIKNLEN